jgi:two-component system phosphate regulon sensor histidine kinase PhoR
MENRKSPNAAQPVSVYDSQFSIFDSRVSVYHSRLSIYDLPVTCHPSPVTCFMSFRKPLASALCLAVASAAAALYFSRPLVALTVVVSAFVGAVAALLLRGGEPDDQIASEPGARAGVEVARRAREGVAAGDGEEAAVAVPARELLEAMMGSMREGLVVVDGGMRVVALNAAAREIFGADEEATTRSRHAQDEGSAQRRGSAQRGGEPRALGELTRNPAVLGAFAETLARGRQVEAKVEAAGRDRRAYDLRVAPLKPRGGFGAQRGAVGIFFDITRLERLERVRQEFLSNVSHELRTPLTAIRTFVETLAAGVVDEPENNRRFLSIIDRNAARMQSLIDDILELSAIESGKVSVEPQPVALRALAQDVLTALAGRARERGVTLCNDVAEGVLVRADARRLEQMLTNLADNAVKFNRERGEVRVAHERTEARDRITVSDTGEGVAPEHVARIFERFYRVDRARSRSLGGTGLGLAIVKHLARAHGGEASVASTPGKGSSFTIELPRQENDEG